jgi:hypothetical protein
MASKVKDQVNDMIGTIGAMQTLLENFPMNLFSFGDLQFATSFDVIAILFKLLGVDREEVVDMLTEMLCGGMEDGKNDDGTGFIAFAEGMVKSALELNIMGLLNCTVNPIISNNLLDTYKELDVEKSGEGILLNVSEIDFTGVLNRNPLDTQNGSKFYFDVEDYGANTLWKSKDFNAYLWYIINMSSKSQDVETVWDNRFTSESSNDRKEILRCTYVDEKYPNADKLKVHICGGRKKHGNTVEPANYYKTRKLLKKANEFALNKTIFEFNHDFLTNIKLYDKKVILAEIIEYLFGPGNASFNIGFSINEEIIQGKIQSIISNVIEADDMEVEDCFFSFSNDEYNDMLEKSEKNRYNIVKGVDGYLEINPDSIYDTLSETSTGDLVKDKTNIKKTFKEITATTAQDSSSKVGFSIGVDWEFDLMRMLVYPFVRPLFTPKVLFLLMVNKKVMGTFTDEDTLDFDTMLSDLMNSVFAIIKDITKKLKDMIIDMMLSYVLEKLSPLLALFASRLLLEALQMYKDLLLEIFSGCGLSGWNMFSLSGGDNQLDNVNYADIEPETESTEPNQKLC